MRIRFTDFEFMKSPFYAERYTNMMITPARKSGK